MNITSFLIYCLIITFAPGPTHIITLSTVQNYGVKRAISFCYVASIAFVIILAFSVTLNSILASFLPKVIIVIQIIGTAYILYLAYQIYKIDGPSNTNKEFGSFKSGFFMQFMNPKVVLFCITIFPSFIMPYYSTYYELYLNLMNNFTSKDLNGTVVEFAFSDLSHLNRHFKRVYGVTAYEYISS